MCSGVPAYEKTLPCSAVGVRVVAGSLAARRTWEPRYGTPSDVIARCSSKHTSATPEPGTRPAMHPSMSTRAQSGKAETADSTPPRSAESDEEEEDAEGEDARHPLVAASADVASAPLAGTTPATPTAAAVLARLRDTYSTEEQTRVLSTAVNDGCVRGMRLACSTPASLRSCRFAVPVLGCVRLSQRCTCKDAEQLPVSPSPTCSVWTIHIQCGVGE